MPGGYVASVSVDATGMEAIAKESRKRVITRAACLAGARVLARALRALAPQRSGGLRFAQGTKAAKGTKGQTGSYAVAGARKKVVGTYKGRRVVPANYHHLADRGTRPHPIPSRRPSSSRAPPPVINHPGAKPTGFVERAARRAWAAVRAAVNRVLAERIAAEIARQGERARKR